MGNCSAHDFGTTKDDLLCRKHLCLFRFYCAMASISMAWSEMTDVKANVIIVITLSGDLS